MSPDTTGADPITMHTALSSPVGHIAHPKPPRAIRPATRDTPSSHGQSILLPLMGLACIGASLIATNLMGEFNRMGGFIAITSGTFFSAGKEVMYPSAHTYLGLILAGPAGGLIVGSLVACMCLGVSGLWSGRRGQAGKLSRSLGLITALLLPLLLLDYMVYSAIEFTSAQAMLWTFDDQPALQRAWVPVALSCAAVLCLTADWLILRWTRRWVDRLSVGHMEPAAV